VSLMPEFPAVTSFQLVAGQVNRLGAALFTQTMRLLSWKTMFSVLPE
jgi:hypothetical protein